MISAYSAVFILSLSLLSQLAPLKYVTHRNNTNSVALSVKAVVCTALLAFFGLMILQLATTITRTRPNAARLAFRVALRPSIGQFVPALSRKSVLTVVIFLVLFEVNIEKLVGGHAAVNAHSQKVI